MGKTARALLGLALLFLVFPFFALWASAESLVMTMKGYRFNQGWGRWEKR